VSLQVNLLVRMNELKLLLHYTASSIDLTVSFSKMVCRVGYDSGDNVAVIISPVSREFTNEHAIR
jgi:hypothetical protein